MFGEEDHKEGRVPVSEQGEKVFQHGEEVVAARDPEQEDADEDDERPDKAGDGLEGPADLLDREGGAVDGDAVHADWEGSISKAPRRFTRRGDNRLPDRTRRTRMNLAKPSG